MFFNDVQNNPRPVDTPHLGDKHEEIHPIGYDGYPISQQVKFPPLSRFNPLRIKPQSNLNAQLFQPGNQIDFELSTPYVEKLLVEFNYNVSTAAVTLNFEFLIDRMEIWSNGQIISTVRGDNLWHSWLFKSYDQTLREIAATNKNASLVPQSVGVGNNNQHFIHLWSLVDYIQPRTNLFKSKFTVRLYFSNRGIVSGSGANISVNSCDLIALTQQLPGASESLDLERKQNRMLKYRFLNPIRAVAETRAMNASSEYFFRLSSSNGLVAFMVFHLNLVGAAPDAFSAVANYELLDENNQIVGINIPGKLDSYLGQSVIGYGKFLFPNVYVISFSFTSLALQGQQSGMYKTTTKEQIKLNTGAGWTNGNYEFQCYTYEYNTLSIDRGVATSTK
jgi:hypothetical protein